MKKQIIKTIIPNIRYSTLSKKINVSKQKKKEEKEWNNFLNKVSNVYFTKDTFKFF